MVGGNFGILFFVGDGLLLLFVADAEVEFVLIAGVRRIVVCEFVIGFKCNCLVDDELIVVFHIVLVDGPQQFVKVGMCNVMVIVVCSLVLFIWLGCRDVVACIGSVGLMLIWPTEAERFISGVFDEHDLWSKCV